MRIIGIQESPNKDGSAIMVTQPVLEGSKIERAEVKLIHINNVNIES